MIPGRWEDLNRSRAEGHIFRKLREETPDDWFGIHSVGLTSHEHKTWAEVDFVIVGPFGVICLEVKGGRITVDRGQWASNEHRLKESPFQQAGGGAAALRRELRELFPPLRRALVEYAVAFPDVSFTAYGPGIEPAILYDDRDIPNSFTKFIERVTEHWRAKKALDDEHFRPLSRSERSAIVAWLAPSFDLMPSLRARIADTEAEFIRLTKNQARILRGMRTKPRAIVRGGAGTGKTLLAVDEASRYAAEGSSVLLCCRSEPLAAYISGFVEEELVNVEALGPMMRGLVAASGRDARLPDADDQDLFAVFLPEQASEAALDLGVAGGFDALIVDEGQDLLFEGALDLLDILLSGGLAEGTWRVFLDHKQNVFSAIDLGQLTRLTDVAVTDHDLVDNCRNTPEIATTTCMLSAVTPDETLANAGIDVDIRFVTSREARCTEAGALLADWIRQGIPPGEVVVLGDQAEPPAELVRAVPRGIPLPQPWGRRTPGTPGWSTIEDFKGLESGAIIVIGIDDLSSRDMLRRVYVGCSRARTLLAIALDERIREEFDARAAEFARRQLAQKEAS